MDLRVGASDAHLRPATRLLRSRILSPLSGLSPGFSFLMRSALEPRVAVAAGDLTGVELLRGHPARGAHHIAGTAASAEGATIPLLAETVERYAQYAAAGAPVRVVYASTDTMAAGSRALISQGLPYFSEEQLARGGFPFSRLCGHDEIGWVEARSLPDDSVCWVPAQVAFVGYRPRPGEPRFTFGVSTGTAAHTSLERAVTNALLELVQIDAAMGNWYGDRRPLPLDLGASVRTRPVDALVGHHLRRNGPLPRFYWLPSADLRGLAIACVIEAPEPPVVAVGLGCELRLDRAIYHAFLEGVAVAKLAKLAVLRELSGEAPSATGTSAMYDLEANVAHYAREGCDAFHARFGRDQRISPSELPADLAPEDLVDGFTLTGKQLALVDLTTPDIDVLGFRVVRVWSPDTLTLSLPGAPPVRQPRFAAYGGVADEAPHPYP